ncbi:MAG: adenosylcobinamide-phosphate synthase CbiB [Deltaproteobacteria bacterium]|jgi:adenosylcobinamide-phosphate synthase|nr:adenosylcobinamide-phosphate synthase CbiB [Deltaproteobacteria bacterium]
MAPLFTFLAFLLDSLLGDPQSWPHPVRVIGKLIWTLEKPARAIARFFSPGEEGGATPRALIAAGAGLYLAVVGLTAFTTWAALRLASHYFFYAWLVIALYLIFTSICLKDLARHAKRVESFLAKEDLGGARQALSWIVGRDTRDLTAAQIRRAEIETLAENFSDGLIAPFLYLSLFGPVGAWLYKATNTLDSMVGYKNDKYLYFGRFSAYADDVLNYIPARLAALYLIAASFLSRKNAREAFTRWRAEGSFHASPNSAQTEATMAGALGVYLGGASTYGGKEIVKPVLGAGGREATADDVRDAEKIIRIGVFLALIQVFLCQTLLYSLLGYLLGWAGDFSPLF